MKKIIVLFKTHLDLGFTNFAENVINEYNEVYIPKAIEVANNLKKRNIDFIWTTGSYLIYNYLNNSDPQKVKAMEKAIADGVISWHGVPCTFHSEICNKDLFEYGLKFAKELDEKYNKNTIAAKFTDVPGHTIGVVPLLANAGIKLLHIGVNPASTPPNTPDLFVWKTNTGEDIIVMYNKGNYGEFYEIPYTQTAVMFAHTNDNMGPQSEDEIISIYENLQKKYPSAQIVAGNLNDVADIVLTIKDKLPIIKKEIGDTWIHGASSDPQKMSCYKGLLRASKNWDEKDRNALYKNLIFIPEHTWGLDEKTHLNDHENFTYERFKKVRKSPKYLKMEKSWQEQRDYLYRSLSELSQTSQDIANRVLKDYKKPIPSLNEYKEIINYEDIKIANWSIYLDENGGIKKLKNNDTILSGDMFSFLYQAFSENEINGFLDRYLCSKADWALEDFGKIGLANEYNQYVNITPQIAGVYKKDNELLIKLNVINNTVEGCPKEMYLNLIFDENKFFCDFAWYNKKPQRIPEALWLKFNPNFKIKSIKKLGMDIDPANVVSHGNREMHCVDEDVTFDGVHLTLLDSPVISIEKPFIYGFFDNISSMDKGIYINLFNNQWGTNFPTWTEGDARFRFEVEITNNKS